ncbi:MAG: acyl-CoA thioesterase [Spirochaetales bacterium]|jgi:acyl-CoA thioester hydrolase|nr:acyl-CoA thioesterase [Spirochaetales bacterium]
MNYAKVFSIELSVRDYECDLQGIVNNAVYLNYFEHTRHQFLKNLGIDFAELHAAGTDPVVRRIEIDYRRSLKSGDIFQSRLTVEKKGRLQYIFRQNIVTVGDEVEMARAVNFVAFVRQGKPIQPPEEIAKAVEHWWSS